MENQNKIPDHLRGIDYKLYTTHEKKEAIKAVMHYYFTKINNQARNIAQDTGYPASAVAVILRTHIQPGVDLKKLRKEFVKP